jgi:hypothetical protein
VNLDFFMQNFLLIEKILPLASLDCWGDYPLLEKTVTIKMK